MHTITATSTHIKIVFDKQVHGWNWDRDQIRFRLKYNTKQSGSILLIPSNIEHFKAIISYASNQDNYDFTEAFLNQYKTELEDDKQTAIKRKLLKDKVTLDTIESRPNLINHEIPQYKHQKMELEYAVRNPAFYSLDEMGLGKTRVAIERHLFLKHNLKRITKSFIICPTTLLYNWVNEIEQWAPNEKYLIISGSKQNKIDEINITLNKIDFYIINYEGINSIKKELLNLIDDKTNIIIDEFIKIKNPYAKRTKNLIDISQKTKYVMGLCGTPISQGSIDLFAPNLIIDKGKKFGFNYESFINKYFWREGWRLIPKRNTYQELSDKLYQNSLRFTKDQCLDIPEKRYQQIPIDLPLHNRRVYDQMLQFAISELEGQEVTAPIILVQLLRLSQITSGFIKTPENKIVEFKEQPKLNALSDLIDSNNGTSIIVWSRFVRDIKAIANLCMSKNISFGCIVGKSQDIHYKKSETSKSDNNSVTHKLIDLIKPVEEPINIETIKKAYIRKVKELNQFMHTDSDDHEKLKKINSYYNTFKKLSDLDLPKDMRSVDYDIPSNLIGYDAYSRNTIVKKFQKGDIQVIIGTASSGGIGINLTKAERVIYYSNDYTLINRLQSEDRAHRSGQKNRVLYYDLIANDTIDISILKVLMGKKSVADSITLDNLRQFAKGKK